MYKKSSFKLSFKNVKGSSIPNLLAEEDCSKEAAQQQKNLTAVVKSEKLLQIFIKLLNPQILFCNPKQVCESRNNCS